MIVDLLKIKRRKELASKEAAALNSYIIEQTDHFPVMKDFIETAKLNEGLSQILYEASNIRDKNDGR